MQTVKDLLKKNIKFYCMFQEADRTLGIRKLGRLEKKLTSFIDNVSYIDTLSDLESFRKAVEPIITNKIKFTTTRYGEESANYGYYSEFLHYARKKSGVVPLIPSLEHGVRFGSPLREYRDDSLCYASLSCNRNDEIYSIDPWRLVFVLGPYIHYARDWYGKEKFTQLKKELGRVLLVFPSHTWEEDSTCGTVDGAAERIMKKYSADYDTVLVCAYWKNIDDPVIKDFEALGARITSAGFRGDINFIRRLKTIIRLADDVVVDDIGTNIGFCMYMKKRVFFEGAEETVWDDAMFAENYRAFREAFHSDNRTFTSEQLRSQQELYDRFWGGDKAILTRSQAGKILSALEEIYRSAGYNVDRLPAAERRFLKNCRDSEQKELIKNALSPKLRL